MADYNNNNNNNNNYASYHNAAANQQNSTYSSYQAQTPVVVSAQPPYATATAQSSTLPHGNQGYQYQRDYRSSYYGPDSQALDGRAAEALRNIGSQEYRRANYNTSALGDLAYDSGLSASSSLSQVSSGSTRTASPRYAPSTFNTFRPPVTYDKGQMSSKAQNDFVQRQGQRSSMGSVSSRHLADPTQLQTTSTNHGYPADASRDPLGASYQAQQRTASITNQQQQPQFLQQSHYSPQAQDSSIIAARQARVGRSGGQSAPLPSDLVTESMSEGSSTNAYPLYTAHPSVTAANSYPTDDVEQERASSSQSHFATVDPNQTYDRWPEHKRQMEAAEKRRAAEQVKREQTAEEAKKVDDAKRLTAVRKREEDVKTIAEFRAAAKARGIEELRWNSHSFKETRGPPDVTVASRASANGPLPGGRTTQMSGLTADTTDDPAAPPTGTEDLIQAEMKAMFEKMRELNARAPKLLAQMWENERIAHTEKEHASPRTVQPVAVSDGTPMQNRNPVPTNGPTAMTSSVPQRLSMPTKHSITPSLGLQEPSLNGVGALQPSTSAPPTLKSTAQPEPAVSAAKPPQNSGTIWPAGKKVHLAKAAATWLNALPKNKPTPVWPDQVSALLDSNPSYIELCEALERMGSRFERAAFARALLTAVPDVTPTPRAQTQSGNPPLAEKTTQVQREVVDLTDKTPASVVPLVVAESKTTPSQTMNKAELMYRNCPRTEGLGRDDQYQHRDVPNEDTVRSRFFAAESAGLRNGSRSKTGSDPGPLPSSIVPAAVMVPRQSTVHSHVQSLEKPASKEAAARKRTFGEIVDLTVHVSDDDPPPPQKKPELGLAAQSITQPPQRFPPTTSLMSTMNFKNWMHAPNGAQQQATTPNAPITQHVVENAWRGVKVVESINRTNVARKSRYDPKTVARDVLLATGRHPDMRPLNAHLRDLRKTLAVDINSDLSTLWWDMIDPSEPKTSRDTGATLADVDMGDADDEDDTGTEDTRTRVVAHRGATGADGSTIYIASERRLHPNTDTSVVVEKRRRGRPHRDDTSRVGLMQLGPTAEQHSAAPKQNAINATSRASNSTQTQNRQSTSTETPMADDITANKSVSAARGSSGSPAVGYAAFRQIIGYNSDGTPIKKKGRPVGWRKSIHGSAAVTERTGATPTSNSPRNAKRPTNASTTTPTKRSRGSRAKEAKKDPQPAYLVFKCQWRDCRAELHNLETLREHVTKLHGKPAIHGGYDCFWDGCRQAIVSVGERGKGKAAMKHASVDFSTQSEWSSHMEKVHFSPLAWSLGDGPAAGVSDHNGSTQSDYLSDAQGRTVTTPLTMSKAKENGKNKSTGRSTREKKETALEAALRALKELTERKRAMGLGAEGDGCILVNAARKAGFIDDEDFEEDIEDDDEQ
ncbi:hypothetical protein B0A49_06301 [Cryomyces minteri]|uniref:C2H2-type domain-containing protein n=1 Tax=Cryomyces minteri TaxID=331657 RepID=A0A4U0X2H4_9PEZI|nr:hypothetical protein B0A49_06301 [Cryomyces minteri]